jgi:eukaryotic-like serine/threonine-protein kinase
MNSEHLIGQTIDRYRIIKHIAQGGMADVYLAEDIDLKRKVALKVMLDTLSMDSQFVQRFRREAQTVAKLEHTNIVQVYSTGLMPAQFSATQQPYLAMQYIDGGSLQDKLEELANRGKLLTTEQALNVARQIAQALAVAHNARVVHRDLKPSNVLIRPDGTPVLVDLGIAVVSGGTKLTQTGSLIGTPYYMSPEQVRGKPLDGRSDLYSLGIILYEILAGMRPFEADESIAVLHKQVYEEPLPLDKFRPDLTPQTLQVVKTALQKEPLQRYQRAEDMILAIDQALQAEGMQGPNPNATYVLTQLDDASLVSRQQIVRVPTGMQQTPRLGMPIWAIVALSVLATAVILFFLFRTFGDSPIAAVTATETAEPEIVYVTAIVTETPDPSAATAASNVESVADGETSEASDTAVVSTETPLPSPTTEPTTPPTSKPTTPATAVSTNTPLPTAIPTNTPVPQPTSCSITVYTTFATTWSSHANQLACPTANGKSGVWLAQESFSGGRMFWRQDNSRIYVLYNSGGWVSYADTWSDSEPEYACGSPESPPTPKRGFGKIWCTYDAVRNGLGNATDIEWGENGAVQDFSGGLILRTGSGQTYVFYSNGTWR